jgi:ATP-dependent DNA helicase RecG
MLRTPVVRLTNIGPSYSNRLKKLNITTLEDLLYHFPSRYEDLANVKKLNSVAVGEKTSAEGIVWQIRNIRTKYGKQLTFATINDGTASIEIVWFNQPYITRIVKTGQKLGLAGKVDYFNNNVSLINPEYEFIHKTGSPIHTRGVVPIYPETKGVSSKWLRTKIKSLLESANLENYELLAEDTLRNNNLEKWYTAMKNIHFPKNLDFARKAKERFAFEELLLTQLSALKRKREWESYQRVNPLLIDQEKIVKLISNLPFELTSAQKKTLREISKDFKSDKPMNRLLQGDVGSGKTVVAAIASYITILNGFSVILMAPTEILATQHLQTLESLLKPHGIKVGLHTGSRKTKEKTDLTVGTHALISSKNFPGNLGLVIIDEQHRFGVEQRSTLRKKGVTSHFLTMSATPIPRTMALTLYGDLDLSVIDELPEGRQKIKTFVVPKEKRDRAYNFIRRQIKTGRQAFITCPLIDPSETLNSVRSATKEWERLRKEIFPDLNVGLLHGRQKIKEKDKVLSGFKSGKIDILVSTPVVEVGIDIPNATIMMIEASERFGLAQLHQMRGRVGRSANQSFCLLFTEARSNEIIRRLKYLEKKHIGLELAELDLKIRGPGKLYGTAQHGISSLKVANLSDIKLIDLTRLESRRILRMDPNWEDNKVLKQKLTAETVSPD